MSVVYAARPVVLCYNSPRKLTQRMRMGFGFVVSLFNMAYLNGSRKGLAKEREAGDITDGRKPLRRKEEGNAIQSLEA